MKITFPFLTKLAVLPVLVALSAGSASAQTGLGTKLVEKLNASIAKVENACASDIKQYCKDVTPGEGRMVYCMQAHEDKISPSCEYALDEAAGRIQATLSLLEVGVAACKAEITGVCGKVQPGQGRVAECLIANKATASKPCADVIQKAQDAAAAE